MERRRNEGDETWSRLSIWTKGQKASERLSAQILRFEGYNSVDPSHPLGGRDELKDVVCIKDDKRWIGASYFPRGKKNLTAITKKFSDDCKGVESNNATGIAFITNQELSLSQRAKLQSLAQESKAQLDLFHLERVAQILDTPTCYGIRLEFLDIEMSKEEQLAFFASRDNSLKKLHFQLESLVAKFESSDSLKSFSVEDIKEFKRILDSIAGSNPFFYDFGIIKRGGHITDLQVPLREIQEFEKILNRVVKVNTSFTSIFSGIHTLPTVQDLKVPLEEIQEYEITLNRIIHKLKEAKEINKSL